MSDHIITIASKVCPKNHRYATDLEECSGCAEIAQARKEERERCIKALRKEHYRCAREITKYKEAGYHDKANIWEKSHAQALVCMQLIADLPILEADNE